LPFLSPLNNKKSRVEEFVSPEFCVLRSALLNSGLLTNPFTFALKKAEIKSNGFEPLYAAVYEFILNPLQAAT
jgi:hypothetical protein